MSIITISRGDKSGGTALATCLASQLGYTCLSREILTESARKYNIEEDVLQSQMSRPPGFWQRLTRERYRYLAFVRASLLQAANEGDLVYHGHAGQILLEGIRHVLKVRIVAPIEQRVQTLMKEQGLDHGAARAHIERVDAERRRWVSFLYHRDWSDPALYDLVINLEGMSIDAACDIVARAVEHPDFQPTEESRKHLHNVWLECEVMAALVADDRLWNQDLKVTASDGSVVVRGRVKNQELRDLVGQIVPLVKGVKTYDVYVTLTSDPLSEVPMRE